MYVKMRVNTVDFSLFQKFNEYAHRAFRMKTLVTHARQRIVDNGGALRTCKTVFNGIAQAFIPDRTPQQ